MSLGATKFDWRPDVAAQVQLILSLHSALTANTYVAHPFPGWRHVSADFWGPGGRGDAADLDLLLNSRAILMNQPGPPIIRHTILEHELWTSWGGTSFWAANDHSGRLRHLHVTWWK